MPRRISKMAKRWVDHNLPPRDLLEKLLAIARQEAADQLVSEAVALIRAMVDKTGEKV